MATIKDIAKKANVSVSTVSYALNGGPRNVPAEVRERIFQIAKELEYRPNSLAKSMVTGRTNVLGIVAPEVVNDMAASPFFAQVLNAIVNECETSGHDVLIFTRISALNSNESIFSLIDGRCDGLIFIAPNEDSHGVTFLSKIGFPHVVINGECPGTSAFNVNNEIGMHTIVDHLVSLGHTNIAHIAGPRKLVDANERRAAFSKRMAHHGHTPKEDDILIGDFNQAAGLELGLDLLNRKSPPTAICCGN
ncbi:MAG TPA: LacI family DNA-binding transcriptional regulator, partial [Fimbriimonas sp.]|nr:LacI family DNA-binding transcriptional regulator [Fimbriimonas sp.]